MTETRLTEKISESITSVFKKSEVFEKWEKTQIYVTSFLFISSIVSLTSIYLNYINAKDLYNIRLGMAENETTLESIIRVNHIHSLNEHCKLKSEISTLGKQFSEIIENQKIIINHLEEIKNRYDVNSVIQTDTKSSNTSINSFSPNKVPSLVIECTLDISEDNKEQDYDELLNECYDSIPLNNIKKNTNLSWLFK